MSLLRCCFVASCLLHRALAKRLAACAPASGETSDAHHNTRSSPRGSDGGGGRRGPGRRVRSLRRHRCASSCCSSGIDLHHDGKRACVCIDSRWLHDQCRRLRHGGLQGHVRVSHRHAGARCWRPARRTGSDAATQRQGSDRARSHYDLERRLVSADRAGPIPARYASVRRWHAQGRNVESAPSPQPRHPVSVRGTSCAHGLPPQRVAHARSHAPARSAWCVPHDAMACCRCGAGETRAVQGPGGVLAPAVRASGHGVRAAPPRPAARCRQAGYQRHHGAALCAVLASIHAAGRVGRRCPTARVLV